jgi:DNA-binding response OmpR family regulator
LSVAVPERILLVDDEERIRFSMGEYFRDQGFEVDCAGELDEAQGLLSTHAYGLVIADLRLSGIYGTEGLELASFIRAHHPATRVLMLTGYGSSEIEVAARRVGVDEFVHKPKSLKEIARIVVSLLRSQS